MNKIELKLFIVYSKSGNIEKLANNIPGINSVDGVTSILRTVPKVSFENEKVINDIPNDGHLMLQMRTFLSVLGWL